MEVIVVIAIIGIMSTIAFKVGFDFGTSQQVELELLTLASIIDEFSLDHDEVVRFLHNHHEEILQNYYANLKKK